MKTSSLLCLIVILALLCGCEGDQGVQGPPGDGTAILTDPHVMPKLIYTFPKANSIGPYDDYRGLVMLRFNKFMRTADLQKGIKLTSLPDSLSRYRAIVNDYGGNLFWVELQNQYGYSAKGDVGQGLRLTIDADVKDINNNPLGTPYSMTIVPEPTFRVVSFLPGDRQNACYGMQIWFNSQVDTSILSQFEIIPPMAGHWQVAQYFANLAIDFFSAGCFKNNVTYTVIMKSSAHDSRMNYIPRENHWIFTTTPFEIMSTSPSDGSKNIPSDLGYIEVNTTGCLDWETLDSAFTITPYVSGNVGGWDWSSDDQFIYGFDENLQPNTTYRITLSRSLRNCYGDSLEAPFTFSFMTGN